MAGAERNIRVTRWMITSAIVGLSILRFLHIEADFPSGLNWSGDLYTDEGWYSSGAIALTTTGQWLVEGDFNPIVNMPMLHVILAGVFRIAGMSLASARFTIVAWSLAVTACTYILVTRFEGKLAGGIAALVLSANFTLFAYSRLTLNEIPMMGWLLLSILMATSQPSIMAVLASAVFCSAAILTKPTAVFAVPVLLYAIWHRTSDQKSFAKTSMLFLLLVAALAGGYHVWASVHSPMDYSYFNSLNLEPRLSLAPRSLVWNAMRTVWHSLPLYPIFFPLATASALWLLYKKSRTRSSPVLWIAILWMTGYSLILAASSYHPPRYFIPLVIPMALLVALVSSRRTSKGDSTKAVWFARFFVLAALLLNLVKIIRYVGSPEYSFIRMANDIRIRTQAGERGNDALLGNLAHSIGLATGLRPFNDRLGWLDLTDRLEMYSPDYYISLGVYEGLNQTIAQTHELELLATYDVFENYYSGKRVYFYRLTRREAGG